MTNLDVLIAECKRQDEEMLKVTARIGNICDKIREDITNCDSPADCKAEEEDSCCGECSVEFTALKKASL